MSQQQGSGSGFISGLDNQDTSAQVAYRCMECNTSVKLAKGDAIRCSGCGHRVLYKERTKRMVQFEAR
jgi:DNA-directed RNA polymerases I, II, and III subunit RPABC4